MTKNPLCSIVMAVYNGAETLKEAIDSVLNQTLIDFEFIIINDASNDNSELIIKSYDDPRIIYIKNSCNKYLGPSLNEGIKIAQGDYIVRMDADDICLPNRLENQYNFMEKNRSIGISGTWAQLFGIRDGILKYETEDSKIKIKLLYDCHILHPSIIIRKSLIFKQNLFYDHNLQHSEDYDLFVRAFKHTEFANIGEVLIKYRTTESSETRETDEFRNKFYNSTKIDLFQMLGIKINETELMLYKNINLQRYNETPDYLLKSQSLLKRMIESNKKTLLFNQKAFENHIIKLFENVCRNSKESSVHIFKVYCKSSLRSNILNKVKILSILLSKIILSTFKK